MYKKFSSFSAVHKYHSTLLYECMHKYVIANKPHFQFIIFIRFGVDTLIGLEAQVYSFVLIQVPIISSEIQVWFTGFEV